MRYHHHLTESALEILNLVLSQGKSLDLTLEQQFKVQKKWGSRDRRFVSELVFETIRWFRKRLAQLGVSYSEASLKDLATIKKAIAAEIYFRENAYPEVLLEKWGNFPVPTQVNEESAEISTSDFLYQKAMETFKAETNEMLGLLNQVGPVFLRPNLNRMNLSQLKKHLAKFEIQFVEHPGTLEINDRTKLRECLKEIPGTVEIQDINSQKVVELLAPQNGEWILDACAGKGGKTLQIAQKVTDKGKVFALDVFPEKVKMAKKRIEQAGYQNCENKMAQPLLPKDWNEHFDRVLLDVPCSGVGVIRRHPERKYIDEKQLQELTELQAQILNRYAPAVKRDGVLVYSTCSFIQEENSKQIEAFLKKNPSFQLVSMNLWTPKENGGDILFAAKLKRTY